VAASEGFVASWSAPAVDATTQDACSDPAPLMTSEDLHGEQRDTAVQCRDHGVQSRLVRNEYQDLELD
jgi:hemin uptake protein HemP